MIYLDFKRKHGAVSDFHLTCFAPHSGRLLGRWLHEKAANSHTFRFTEGRRGDVLTFLP